MLLHSVTITNFRRIGHARIEFDRGLNVLYGPNELGKSTVAEAIRAAFLLPSTSSEGKRFVPWGIDVEPQVVVEFETTARTPAAKTSSRDVMHNGESGDRQSESDLCPHAADVSVTTRWRITKAFSGPRGSALLERIAGQGRVIQEAKGRDVDGRLRELLGWGLTAPGGKGAPRGFADSYLTTVLLGEQDQVTAVLTASLDGDKEESGRRLLTESLGALGRDPLIVRMLERLESQTTEVYTKTGQHRRTRDNPLAQQAERIRQKEARIRNLQEQARTSDEIEQQVAGLKRREYELSEQLGNGERSLIEARTIAQARNELSAAIAHQQALHQAAVRLKAASDELETAIKRQEDALRAVKCCEGQLATAREHKVRLSQVQKQAVEAAAEKLKSRRAELITVITQLRSRIRIIEDVEHARALVITREYEVNRAQVQFDEAREERERTTIIADIASLIAGRREATARVGAAKAARQECEQYEAAERESLAALQAVTNSLDVAEQALAREREQIESSKLELQRAEDRADSFRTKLLNAQALEQQARNHFEDARRLVQAEQDVADRATSMQRLDKRLSEVEHSITDCEILSTTSDAALHRQILVLIGGAVLTAGAIVSGAVLADWRGWLIAIGVALLAGLTLPVSRIVRARSNRAALAADRDRLRDQRSELTTRRMMAEEQLASSRRSFEQARDRVLDTFSQSGSVSGDGRASDGLLQQAESFWKQACEERARIEAESQHASSSGCDPASAQSAFEQLCTRRSHRERQIRGLKTSQSEYQDALNGIRQELSAAREREKVAAQCAADIRLDQLDSDLSTRLSECGLNETAVPDQDDAIAAAQAANQAAHEAKTAWEVADRRLGDARAAWDESAGKLEQPVEGELESLRAELAESESQLERLGAGAVTDAEDEQITQQVSHAAEAVLQLEQELLNQEAELAAAGAELRRVTHERDEARLEYEKLQGQENGSDVTHRIANLNEILDAAAPEIADLADSLETLEGAVNQNRRELQQLTRDLQKAHGQLEHVGGAVVRDELAREQEQLEQLRASADDLELEYQATRRLLDRLTEADARHAEHLGRQLSGPVREKFLALTANRYRDVLFARDLAVTGVEADGGSHETTALSVGTQDQLATLIRLAIAAHLRTTLLLDDQLAQSDPHRMKWLRDCLRNSAAANSHQIIVATCRPDHYIDNQEPASEPATSDGCRIREIDLESILSIPGGTGLA